MADSDGQSAGERGLTRESVVSAYRVFLDRDPEDEAVIQDKLESCPSMSELRKVFLSSDEYRRNNPPIWSPRLRGDEPAMEVDEELSEADLRRLFDHVQMTWQHLGEVDPYWSVLTVDKFHLDQIEQNREQFYKSGAADATRLVWALGRNGLDPGDFGECLDYGCGLGRVVRWLSGHFGHVHGVDISRSHLDLAQAYLGRLGIANTTLHLLGRLEDLEALPRVDLVHSVIVLQHNPPPVIRHVLQRLLGLLRPGGVAYFQVPTYREGYRFRLDDYLGPEGARLDMEMHVLRQSTIFEVIREEGCIVLEVSENAWTGSHFGEVSNTFLVRKGI